MANTEIEHYVQTERAKGKDNDTIFQALLQHGWDSIVAHRAVYGIQFEKQRVDNPVKQGPSGVLLAIGIGIIAVAVTIFIGESWQDLSPLSRFLFVAIPNILLFAIAGFLGNDSQTEHIKDGTAVAGLLILPVSIGVFLYQFGLINRPDSLLEGVSVALATPAYLYAAFGAKKSYAATLMLVATIAGFLFFVGSDLDQWLRAGIVLLFSFALFITTLDHRKRYSQGHVTLMETTVTILLCYGLPAFVSGVADKLGSSSETNALVTSIIGGGSLLAAASVFGKMAMPMKRDQYWQQRVLLVFGMIIMFFSLLGAGNNAAVYALISVVLGAAVALLGSLLRIRVLLIGGIVGGVINLLSLLFGNVDTTTILVIMFMIGFAAIGLSIYLARHHSPVGTVALPAANHQWGLVADQELANLQINTDWSNPSAFTVIMRVILIFIGMWMASFVLTQVFDSSVSQRFDSATGSSQIKTL